MADTDPPLTAFTAEQIEALVRSINSGAVEGGAPVKQKNDAKLFKKLELEQFAQAVYEKKQEAEERYASLKAEAEAGEESVGSRLKLRAIDNHIAARRLQSRLRFSD